MKDPDDMTEEEVIAAGYDTFDAARALVGPMMKALQAADIPASPVAMVALVQLAAFTSRQHGKPKAMTVAMARSTAELMYEWLDATEKRTGSA